MRRLLSILLVVAVVMVFVGASFAQKGMSSQYPIRVDPVKAQQYCKEVQPLYQKDLQLRGNYSHFGRNPSLTGIQLNKRNKKGHL